MNRDETEAHCAGLARRASNALARAKKHDAAIREALRNDDKPAAREAYLMILRAEFDAEACATDAQEAYEKFGGTMGYVSATTRVGDTRADSSSVTKADYYARHVSEFADAWANLNHVEPRVTTVKAWFDCLTDDELRVASVASETRKYRHVFVNRLILTDAHTFGEYCRSRLYP